MAVVSTIARASAMRDWLVILCVLGACGDRGSSSEEVRTTTRPPTGEARSAPPEGPREAQVGRAPEPQQLPICEQPMSEEPLAAICKLGTPAAEFPFGCDQPLPLSFCRKTINWSCRGSNLPNVTFHAHDERTGPMPAQGQAIDLAAMKRAGPTRAIEVHVRINDESAGERRATEIAETLERWGCLVVSRGDHAHARLDCGSWEATVSYNEIIHMVLLDAAERGWLGCM